MTRILFQRCDGKPAGEPVVLPRGRRRLSSIARAHADRARPHIVSVHRRANCLAVTDFGLRLKRGWSRLRMDPLAVTNASVRMRKDWRRTTLGPLDTVIITYLPRGGGGASSRGGGGGKGASIALIVATVALAAIGQFWAIGAIGGALGVSSAVAGTIWASASAVALAGGAYLLSQATKAKANKDDANRPVYGVSGGGNQPRTGDRIPVLYGRCWNTPDLSQPDFTVYDGDDQVLYKRLTIGCGSYALKSIRVAGATMYTDTGGIQAPFTGSQIELILPGQTSSLVPGQVATVAAVSGLQVPHISQSPFYAGPFDFGADAEDQTRIQLDFSWPQGVYQIGTGKWEGKQFPTTYGVTFEYAPCDEDGNPTTGFSTLYEFQDFTLATRAIRKTQFVDIAAGRYCFRAYSTGTPDGFNGTQQQTTVVWEGLRSHIPGAIVRPGVTELAMVIRSGKSLGVTAFAAVEVESSRILPVWNGSAWVDQETRKAVWAYADILRDSRHGAGLADSVIDVARLASYAGTVSAYDTFDGVIRGPVSVYEAATTVLGTMRAAPVRLGSVWSLVRDEQKLVRKHVISRRQILKDSTGQTFNLDLSDGSADIIVEWLAEGDPKRRRDHHVTFGTVTNVPRRVMLTGVSSGEHAIHLATWMAASAYYRRERRSVTTEMAGRLVLPADKAMIDAWYFDARDGVGVLARDGLDLTIDSEITLPEDAYAVLRARDGREWGPVAVTESSPGVLTLDATDVAQAESLSGLDLDEVLATATQSPTTLLVGELTEVQDGWLVRSVGFSGESNVTIEAVYDAPEVWTALGEPIVAPPPPPSSGLENEAQIQIAYIEARAVQRGVTMFADWSLGRARVPVDYVVRLSYDDWQSFEDVYRGPASSGSHPIRESTDFIKMRAYAVSSAGIRSAVVETQFTAAKPVITDLTASPRLDYNALVAAVRYRTEQLPQLEPLFGALLESQVDAFEGRRLAETGIRRIDQVETDLTQALATTSTELRAQIDSTVATFTEQIVALVETDAATSARLTELEADLGDTLARIVNEEFVRASETQALAQAIAALTATVGQNAASTSSALQALVNADGAFAQQLATVDTKYGNLFAGGKVRFAAVAAPAGVFARYSIELEASAGGATYATGLFMEIIQQGPTSFYSQIFIDANRLVLGNPAMRSVPFQVVDGVTYIDDVVIRTGSISRHAAADSAGDSATVSIPVRAGAVVTITAVYKGGQTLVNGGGSTIRVYRNGSQIHAASVSSNSVAVNAGGSIAYYNSTTVLKSYDVSSNQTDSITVSIDPASGIENLTLSGISLLVTTFNK
ncbi:MAG TPA: host specificity factor TipJ family phage tail protein [Bosea sp. (in: a-proteobacteria)]|jgi:predicted phage tail protein|uniref:host specificity factor TipJ family phage tail protein n=1 Tax=Bosea sp. (in: a-proteobacteria) TaxID=1871050 RepID=UPI002DDD9D5F|nr:host specificity factor TipJ family phage tail protein [Bosea sp. (in: a-proteobacteria)]HEV2552707.1 host specificity factor TipJ family phage tail protein [Bosea sp. (in: a-proteobacteria)]